MERKNTRILFRLKKTTNLFKRKSMQAFIPLVDAASFKICPDCHLFYSMWKKETTVDFIMGDGYSLKSNYESTVDLVFCTDCGQNHVAVQKVLYILSSTVIII